MTLVPHTHWDREWYEPFAVFSDRLVAMMDGLLDLEASGFPHFHLDGQTAMIDDYLERRPERARELAGQVREGRLSAGPWFTQMDEFLASGESHIRNLEVGLARARDLGRALEVGYMPDQFGHIGQMPQILRNGGVDRAAVWRGVPRAIDRTAFRWHSPDGSEVLTEYLIYGYFNGGAFGGAADPVGLADAISDAVDRARPALASDRVLVMVGYDHSGPDPTLPRRLKAAAPQLDGLEVSIGGLADHLDGTVPDGLPVWSGELRSSARAHLLPNVYSARVHQKRERGRVESLLERYAEPLAALTPGFGRPTAEFARAWTLLLWNGAHDSACGCSHDQVAADVDGRFAEARAICEDVVERTLTSLGSRVAGQPGVIRYNPSPFEREGVPPLGYAVVPSGREPGLEPASLEELPDRSGVSLDGAAVSVVDEPDVGDLYTFCPPDIEGGESRLPERISIDGDEVDASWNGLRVLFRVTRRVGEPFFRIEGVVHNERPDHRLRLHVRLPQGAVGSIAGAPFELVARPLVGEGSEAESPSATWPARHVAVAAGVAVLHEGVFEYEITGPELAVTLLRCVGTISRERLATRPWAAGPATPTPAAQMIGETAFALALWPSAPDDPAELLAGWERFALPIVEAPASGGGELPPAGSLLDLMTGDAQLSGVRRGHDDGHVEVRLWNPYADRSTVATVAGRSLELRPARIETLKLDAS